MRHIRRYVQFAELVFDVVEMVESDTYTSKTKNWDKEYTYKHGSYYPKKRKESLWKMGHVSMTLILDPSKLPCEDRPYYVRFAKSQLDGMSRLWAVQGSELLWAWADVDTIREYHSERWNRVSFDVSFNLPEGVWHKADKQRTFMIPYDVCDYMDCFDIPDVQPGNMTADSDWCCDECRANAEEQTFCDCCGDAVGCDVVTKDMAYCYHVDDLRDMGGCDAWAWRMKYDCAAAEKFFGDFMSDKRMGQKFCSTCGKIAAGWLLSDTDIPTEEVKITLHGTMHNPYIEINGNGNWIRGDFDGVLVLTANGEMYTYADADADCPACDPLPIDTWVIPQGMTWGWKIQPGRNRVVVDFGDCCAGCAYIEVSGYTY